MPWPSQRLTRLCALPMQIEPRSTALSFPEHLIDEKAELFAQFVSNDEFLFFTHDPQIAAARLLEHAGRFQASHEIAAFDAWDLDTQAEPRR